MIQDSPGVLRRLASGIDVVEHRQALTRSIVLAGFREEADEHMVEAAKFADVKDFPVGAEKLEIESLVEKIGAALHVAATQGAHHKVG